jgi:hypothetical protein
VGKVKPGLNEMGSSGVPQGVANNLFFSKASLIYYSAERLFN